MIEVNIIYKKNGMILTLWIRWSGQKLFFYLHKQKGNNEMDMGKTLWLVEEMILHWERLYSLLSLFACISICDTTLHLEGRPKQTVAKTVTQKYHSRRLKHSLKAVNFECIVSDSTDGYLSLTVQTAILSRNGKK